MPTSFPIDPTIHTWGNPEKSPILFVHANSYSAQLYKGLLEPLFPDYHILAPDLPGHGESRWVGRVEDWQDLADYYIAYFDRHPPKRPFVGMGHSIGGIIVMLMSVQRPDLFVKLILLDPVMLPKGILTGIKMLRLLSMTHIIPLAKAANRRRTAFPDRTSVSRHYATKEVFSRWAPGFLEAYAETCLHEIESGEWQLSCAPLVESSIYQSIPLTVWSLPQKLTHPSLFLIGKYSDTINHRGFRRLQKRLGNHVVKRLDGGHLFPFEKPGETLEQIKDFLI